MKKPVFRGACTALVTPFRNGGIDYETLDRLLDTQLAAGIEALVICGTTGEAATLDQPETLAIIAHCVRYCGGKTRLIAGTGGNNTAKAVETARAAAALGVDALLSVTPYYNRCTQEGLLAHYGAIAAATSLPVLLYNVPSRTCVDISPETVARLAELPTVAGIKEANPDVSRLLRLRALCGSDFPIYCGNDDQVPPAMALGARGVISVAANVVPRPMRELTHAWLEGDPARALDWQLRLLPLIRALFSEVSPTPVKAALKMMGMDSGILRLPLTEISQESFETLLKAMRDAGINV